MSENISGTLLELLNKIEQIVDEEREDLPLVEIEFTRSEYEKYDYQDIVDRLIYEKSIDERPIEHTLSSVNKQVISRDVKNDKIISKIENTDLYNSTQEKIKSEIHEEIFEDRFPTSDMERHIKVLLDAFVKEAVDIALDTEGSTISEENKTGLISALVRKIENPKSLYIGKIWIHGIGLEGEEFEITENFSISRPKKEEMVYEIERENMGPNDRLAPLRLPTLQINRTFRARHYAEAYEEFTNVVSILRLFSGVGVQLVGFEFESQSELGEPYRAWVDPSGQHTKWHGMIKEETRDYISDFFDNIETPFRELISDAPKQNHLSIAYDRYEDAVSYDDSIEESIASTIMSLEALFLKENEKSELSERLGQRTGLLLGYFGYEPIEVYQRIKKGYSVRSSYVHGTQASEDFSDELGKRTTSFARQSLILYLQLHSEYEKSDIISKIDNAVMSTNAREQFKEEISEECDYIPKQREMI